MSWKQEDGWNRPGDRSSHRRPRDRNKPAAPTKGDSGELSTWETSRRKSDKNRRRRSTVFLALGVVAVLLLLVALAPTAASMFAPGIIASKATDAIAGRVEVDSVSLRWFGGQRVEGISLYDDRDSRRANLTARADKGLIGLLFAGGDYGTITLSGDADLSTDDRGRTFLEHTLGITAEPEKPTRPDRPTSPDRPTRPDAPRPTPEPEPIALPAGLRATLALDDLRIVYADHSARTPIESVRLEKFTGHIALDAAATTSADLSASVQLKKPASRVFENAGSVRIKADIRDLTDPTGLVQTDRLTADAAVQLRDLATELLDVLPDLAGRAVPAIGPTISITLTAKGAASDLAAGLTASSESITVEAPVRIDLTKGNLRSAGPIRAGLDLARLSMLMPDRETMFGPEADLHVTTYPRLDVTIEDLNLPIPPRDTADLRGAGARLRAEIGRMSASVRAPGETDRRAVGFEPAVVTLDAPDLAGQVTLTTGLGTMIDSRASGTLRVELAAEGLLDDAGSPGALPQIRGELRAQQLVLAAFQPIAMAAGFDLTGIIGDTADITLTATPAGSDDPTATALALDARADHASITGGMLFQGRTLRTTGDGFDARLARLAPLLADAMADAGVTLRGTSPLTVKIPELFVDLDRITENDLSTLRLSASAGIERIRGVLAESGETLEATGFSLDARTRPLRDGLRVTSKGAFRLNDADAGSLDADIRLAGLLDDAGAPTGGLPSEISGRVSARSIRAEAIQPFLAGTPIDFRRDIGPGINLTITATATPEPDATVPPTDLVLDIRSRSLNGSGAFRLTADRLESTGEGLRITLDNPGGLITRNLELDSDTTLAQGGLLTLAAEGVRILLDPEARTPDLPNSAGVISVNLAGLVLAEGENTGAVEKLAATARLRPGQDPRVELDGAFRANNQRGSLAGGLDILGAFAQDGPPVRPVGDIKGQNLPIRLLRHLAVTLPREGQPDISLYDFVRLTFGERLDLNLETRAEGDRGLSVALNAGNEQHTARGSARLTANAEGAFELAAINADAELLISDRLARTVLSVAAPPEYASIRVPDSSKARFALNTDNKGLLAGRLDLDRTTIQGLPIPDEAGGTRVLDPIALAANAGLSVPLAMLNDQAGTHPVSLTLKAEGFEGKAEGLKLLDLDASASTALRESRPAGRTNARLRLACERTDWLDALAGLSGMLPDALGPRVNIDATLEGETNPDGSIKAADASVEIRSQRLRTSSPIRLTSAGSALDLAAPFEARWDVTPTLFNTLFPAEPGKAAQLRLARRLALTLQADELHIPLAGSPASQTRVRTTITAPEAPLLFPDGTEYEYRDLRVMLATLDKPGSASLRASANDPARPGRQAFDLNATVAGLPDGSDQWTPENLLLTGRFGLDGFPVRLVDAVAAGDGQLVELLGPTLDLEANIKDLPRRGGTLAFDAKTAQASSRLRSTVRPHPADRNTLAVTLDEPMRTELTHFDYQIQGKKVALLPVFGSITKDKARHSPAAVDITRLVAPVDGAIDMILLDGTVSPGVVDFQFDRGLALLLRITKQRSEGAMGESLQPFKISMKDGIARFDDLVVPVGEFRFSGRGAFDLVNQTEDITLSIPAGAFAQEVLGALPGALGGTLRTNVNVPVRRRGPLGAENQWQPDFQSVIKELFSPENLLQDAIQGGLRDLINPGNRPGGGG